MFFQVMQKQLLLFHNAVAGYFSGNQTALDATMKQFAIKVLIFLSIILSLRVSRKEC